MSWTSEPWQQWEDHPDIFAGAITHNDPFRLSGGERVAEFATDDDGCDRGVANAARAVACVNACVGIADPAQYLATLRARVAELEGALVKAKIRHFTCEDSWYSCPKSPEGCVNENAGSECNCGADQHNAAIDAALAGKEGAK